MTHKPIKNIQDLRNMVLDNINKLNTNEIDLQNAAVSCKAVDTVISTIKTELEYFRMVGKTPYIPFMDDGAVQMLTDESKATPLLENKI